MLFKKVFLLIFLGCFAVSMSGCELTASGDGSGGDSSGGIGSGTAFNCELAEEMLLNGGTFEDEDLGSFQASCSNGVITLSAITSSDEVTSITCDDQTTFNAKGTDGSITMDMSEVSISGENLSGNATYTVSFTAVVSDDKEVQCGMSMTLNMSDPENSEPEGMESLTCTVADVDVTFDENSNLACDGTSNHNYVGQWLAYFSYLSQMGDDD